jgi:hypothetical protein
LSFDSHHDGRQHRLHTCFKSCKDYLEADQKNKVVYEQDSRPNCTDLANASPTGEYEEYLLCLKMDEECESLDHRDEV